MKNIKNIISKLQNKELSKGSLSLLRDLGKEINKVNECAIDEKKILQSIHFHNDLGYDINFTTLYGKDAIRMIKRYSQELEHHVICEQIVDTENITFERFHKVIEFMLEDIKNQETTKKLYRSNESWLNS